MDEHLRRLEERIDAIATRPPLAGPGRRAKLARTVADPETGHYPTRAEKPRKYWIRFIDYWWDLRSGYTGYPRQATPVAVAYDVAEHSYAREATLVAPVWIDGHWYFEGPLNCPKWSDDWYRSAETPATDLGEHWQEEAGDWIRDGTSGQMGAVLHHPYSATTPPPRTVLRCLKEMPEEFHLVTTICFPDAARCRLWLSDRVHIEYRYQLPPGAIYGSMLAQVVVDGEVVAESTSSITWQYGGWLYTAQVVVTVDLAYHHGILSWGYKTIAKASITEAIAANRFTPVPPLGPTFWLETLHDAAGGGGWTSLYAVYVYDACDLCDLAGRCENVQAGGRLPQEYRLDVNVFEDAGECDCSKANGSHYVAYDPEHPCVMSGARVATGCTAESGHVVWAELSFEPANVVRATIYAGDPGAEPDTKIVFRGSWTTVGLVLESATPGRAVLKASPTCVWANA
jgi:hypothetical protein